MRHIKLLLRRLRDSGHGILDAIYARRAVRAYRDEQPAGELIRELLDAAVQAPTAMHLEPWAFAEASRELNRAGSPRTPFSAPGSSG